ILAMCSTKYENEKQYFTELLSELVEENERFREYCRGQGIELPKPDGEPELSARHRFKRYVADVAESLPEQQGSYSLLIAPDEIADEVAFAESMEYLAELTRSPRVKFVVFDRLDKPMLAGLPQRSKQVRSQRFHLPPEEIERRVKEGLSGGGLSEVERRQYAAMAASFAFAHHRHEEADKLYRDALKLAQQGGSAADQATVQYNLANNLLAQGRFEEAEATYNASAQLCLANQLNPLLAMVLSNMAIALQRQGRIDQALESFQIARRTFAALDNPAGEAYVLDSQAQTLAAAGRGDDAVRSWNEALAKYDAVKNPTMTDVREGGRADILAKLDRFKAAASG
ncbi:MAG TPA: tetratricopeptide repeat protein, partial [Pirellulaceae bacterium]|nr:tetratricopeptide repeat protein [Pirellulaceae bacterium]